MSFTPMISVIIPTLNAASEINQLLKAISVQTLTPSEIIVVDSDSDDGTAEIVEASGEAKVIRISRADFNHGATRHMAFLETSGDYVCFLTQDALPVGEGYFEHLVAPILSDPKVALASGRQLPKSNARRFVQLIQGFNYPAEPSVRDASDVPRLGIKAFFASDVCSCYRRSAYLACGGFPSVETNEDMLLAARLIASGHRVAYVPEAAVLHSHNFSPREQYVRNCAIGRFLESYADELMGSSEVGEGGRLVRHVAGMLLREGCLREFAAFGIDCASRLAGNRIGRFEARRAKRR